MFYKLKTSEGLKYFSVILSNVQLFIIVTISFLFLQRFHIHNFKLQLHFLYNYFFQIMK